MRKTYFMIGLLMVALTVTGCGGGDEEGTEASGHGGHGGHGDATAEEATPAASAIVEDLLNDEEEEEIAFVPPFPEKQDPFAEPDVMPEIIEPEPEPEPEPEIVLDMSLPPIPPIRLVGFTRVDNTPRALLSVKGKLKMVGAGDSIDHVDIVDVANPTITLKHGDQLLAMNMYEQAWQNQPGAKKTKGPAPSPIFHAPTSPRTPNRNTGNSLPGGPRTLPGVPRTGTPGSRPGTGTAPVAPPDIDIPSFPEFSPPKLP